MNYIIVSLNHYIIGIIEFRMPNKEFWISN